MAVTNTLIETLKKLKMTGRILKGKDWNPKSDKSVHFGPFHLISYFNNRSINNIAIRNVLVSANDFLDEEEDMTQWTETDLTLEEAEKWTRTYGLERIGFETAKMLRLGNSYNMSIEITLEGGNKIRLIVFPHSDSNVGVFTNRQGVCSFVSDGRVNIVNGKPYIVSSNQIAIEKYIEENSKEESKFENFQRIFNKELWNIKDETNDESDSDDEEETKVKSIIFQGKVRDLEFPRMKDGTPYNTVWLNDTKLTLTDVAEECDIGEYIDLSSLSQNGVVAQCGPLTGRQTTKGMEVGPVKPFKGSKGKLNIRATQGPKVFKAYNNNERCLVVLAELKPNGWKHAENLAGNCITSHSAFNVYMSDLTRRESRRLKIKDAAHKIFIYANGEIVRIKGATNVYGDGELYAETQDGIENKVVVLPPREFKADGRIETDISKFEYLCKYRDSDSKLQLVTLTFQGKKYKVPALYCDIYEDANHSSVISLREKARNAFYYGCIKHLYRTDGFNGIADALSKMLDHQLVAQAMNIAKIAKSNKVELSLDDYLNKSY